MTETQGLIAGFLLFFALFVYTFWPQYVLANPCKKNYLDALSKRKEQLDENLHDLNFEFHAGKFSEEDYQAQRTQLENEMAQLLTEIKPLQKA